MNGSDAPMLEARAVECAYDQRPAVRGVDLSVYPGDFLGLIGPNGAGKSTLLRLLAGVLRPSAGAILLDGHPLHTYPRRALARRIAVVPPPGTALFSFLVREFVEMGRTPYLRRLQGDRPGDLRAIAEALAATDTADLADRPVTELSAGEWQRVNLARALAQQPQVMLLDEPTAFLDLGHQREIFELLVEFNRSRGLTVVCVSHDLNLAAEYCPRLAVLAEGRLHSQGPPQQVLTARTVQEVYGAPVQVRPGPSGRPQVTLLSQAALDGRGEGS